MTIPYYRSRVFGVERMYVKDPTQASAFTRLTGRKTLDESDMRSLSLLGLSFEEVLPPGSNIKT